MIREQPRQYASGISYVFVNGEAVLENAEMRKARLGVALRGLDAAS